MSALKYWLWLTELPGLTNQTRLALLRHFPTPEDVYYADPEEVLLTEGITREQAKLLEDKDCSGADRILADCQRLDLDLLTIQDAGYPNRLRNIYDPPCLLYVRGRLPAFDDEASIAVVGTRDCTPYGVSCAEKLGYGLAAGGAVVVSGLARGVDSAALRGALRAGGTVTAVLGNGLDVVYPPENQYLYEDVAAAGALISEYPPGTPPEAKHFPVRNRIMSGLCLGTLVVEAPARSGALITAGTALEQGRDVFAVPGPIDAPASVGCNRLIRDGAGLVSDAWDILGEYEPRFPDKLRREGARETPAVLGYQARQKTEPKPVPPSVSLSHNDYSLTDDQICLLRALTEEPMLVDDLIELTDIPTRRVLSALTVLEIEHLVTQHSGKRYARAVNLTE
ncbi:DNA-protecting protein DprA [Oscillibacter valericigenes]|uniref:DNA-protecting protein DprA n=1 Tax=Oscillibacter valericigenes TaxID=351091 RepID=A0ABS2FW28_9FIRM|nr:DNA-processing protein DprA [Oscillibacter valericigenes]MBM6851837.1 DNA-protecting protein DprA [Oscillibacter valericigenes]